MAKRPPKYRPLERNSILGLSDALHSGMDPALAQGLYSDIQSEAQTRLAEMEARRQAQQLAAQTAQGQLMTGALSTLSANPEMEQSQLTDIMGAQEAALGLGPKVQARVDNRMPGLMGSLYNGENSIMSPVGSSGMDPATESAISLKVAEAVQNGQPIYDILVSLKNAAIADGVDPQPYIDYANSVYAKFNPAVGNQNSTIDYMANNPAAFNQKMGVLGVENTTPIPEGADLLPYARNAYAEWLRRQQTNSPSGTTNPYAPAPTG